MYKYHTQHFFSVHSNIPPLPLHVRIVEHTVPLKVACIAGAGKEGENARKKDPPQSTPPPPPHLAIQAALQGT